MSFVEIYNEVVYDLLDPVFASTAIKSNTSATNCGGGVGTFGLPFGVRRTPLDLRTDKNGNVFVKGTCFYLIKWGSGFIVFREYGS